MADAVCVARYLIDAAGSGTTPTTLVDDTGNGNDLTISFNSNGTWTNDAEGNGLDSTQTPGSPNALIAQLADISANGNIGPELNGKDELYAVAVLNVEAVTTGHSRVFQVGTSTGDGDFNWTINNTNQSQVRVNAESTSNYVATNSANINFVGAGKVVAIIQVDTKEASGSDRVKYYRDGVQGSSGFSTLDQNTTLTSVNSSDRFLTLMDRNGGSRSFDGQLYYFELGHGILTADQIANITSALQANHDADHGEVGSATLAITAAATADNPTDEGFDVQITTNIPATIDIVPLGAGSAQPIESVFNAASFGGVSVAATEFERTITGLAEATPYRTHFRVAAAGQTTLYDFVDQTTTPNTAQILSVNGGVTPLFGETGIVVNLSQGATGSSAITVNGVAQPAPTVVSDTQVTFDLTAWPNAVYESDVTLALTTPGGVVNTTIQFRPPSGSDYVTVAPGYNASSQVVDASPDLVAGDQIEWVTTDSNLNPVTISNLAVVTISGVTPGNFDVRIIDQSDGARSAAQTISGAGADVIPDQFDLGADVTGAEPAAVTTKSFVLAGVDPGEDVSCVAGDDAQVSVEAGSYATTQSAQNGNTINVRVTAGSFGEVRTGSLEVNGITDSFTVTTRSAISPTITTQPVGQSVLVGAAYGFNVVASGVASYQWYDASDDSVIVGETNASYVGTAALIDNGMQVYCILTSSEGGTTQTNTVTLTVAQQTARITSPVMRNVDTKALLANTSFNIEVKNLSDDTLFQQSVTTNASGIFTIDSNAMGPVGSGVRVVFIQVDALSTRQSFDTTTTAAA